MSVEFEVVPDDRRRPSRKGGPGRARSQDTWLAAVRAGKTVLLPKYHDHNLGGYRTLLRGEGLQLHGRTDPDGLVVWADPI